MCREELELYGGGQLYNVVHPALRPLSPSGCKR